MKTYPPSAIARLRFVTKAFADGTPTDLAAETFRLDIFRGTARRRACQLSRGSTDTAVATTAFFYALAGLPYAKDAVAAGTALAAGTILADDWGVYLLSIDDAGVITVTPGAGNFDGSYVDEAAAIAGLPSTPAGEYAIGFLTVQTDTGLAFVGGTDALAGGASGNPANATNYYTLAERLASASPAGRGALTYAGEEIASASHEMFVDIALAGGGADDVSIDEVEVSILTGTVATISVVGDPVGAFRVAGLTPAQEQILSYFLDGMHKVTIEAGSSAIVFVTDLLEATAEHYSWQTIWMVSGALAGQKIPIVGYEGDGDLRVANRTADIPAAGDIGILIG